jgi:DNA-binding LytR/AlgR family response regulator
MREKGASSIASSTRTFVLSKQDIVTSSTFNTMLSPSPSFVATTGRWNIPAGTLPVFDRQMHFLPFEEIVMIEGDGNYTLFYCTNGRRIMVSKTLRDYEKLLGEKHTFFRVHKSYLINLQHVVRYDVKGEDSVWMKNGKIVGVARRRKQEFDLVMRKFQSYRNAITF